MKIYMIAFFKYDDRGPEYGFERVHLQTFYTSLKVAKASIGPSFCDEAGWYEGAFIEEKVEGNHFHRSKRVFYIQKENGLEEVPEPEYFHDIMNLI